MYEYQIVYVGVMTFFLYFTFVPEGHKKCSLTEKLTFFLSILKLSIMTPMNRFSVKNEPTMINITKNK